MTDQTKPINDAGDIPSPARRGEAISAARAALAKAKGET